MATSKLCGTVVPREVIFKIAQHTEDDVYLSFEHFGSKEAASKDLLRLAKQSPDARFTVEEYRRVGR